MLAPKENDNEEVVSKDMEIVDSDGENDDNNKTANEVDINNLRDDEDMI